MSTTDSLDREVTLISHWHRYLEEVIPPDATDAEIALAKRIFYSGAMTVLAIIMKEHKNPDDFAKMLFSLMHEFHDFENEIKERSLN